jgi:hypothetical protein
MAPYAHRVIVRNLGIAFKFEKKISIGIIGRAG